MLPRLLVIDDLFGRSPAGGRNPDRENLCALFRWRDLSDDAAARASSITVLEPKANVVFCRGQTPAAATIGATVENDLAGSLETIRSGWSHAIERGDMPWTMVLLDLCFYTGKVTDESNRRNPGMPEGRPGDDTPPGYFGLKLLDAIHREFPDLPITILSSTPRRDVSMEFTRRGALGFIARDDLRAPEVLDEALWLHGLLPDTTNTIIGSSLGVLLALREARRAAGHSENVLIRGERGVGKDLLANFIHRASLHALHTGSRPFVPVNSAVLRSELFSSELFGIEPKTATGVDGKIGLVEAANGGDLFLDEIADMPPEAQATLLRVLQDRRITRIGAREPRTVNVRFLSATNVDLEHGQRPFRADLLDRLKLGGTLWLLPLRERKTDIPALVATFVAEAEALRPGSMHRTITSDALELLMQHDWPGNVRELRGSIFDAVNRNPSVEHLVPEHLRVQRVPQASVADRFPTAEGSPANAVAMPVDLPGYLASHVGLRFDERSITAWAGKLNEIQHAQAWLVARYLHAALQFTKRRTAEKPEGILQIHPAVKLITGDATLSASKAADLVKRLLAPLEHELEGDLREAHQIALRLRPRANRSTLKIAD